MPALCGVTKGMGPHAVVMGLHVPVQKFGTQTVNGLNPIEPHSKPFGNGSVCGKDSRGIDRRACHCGE